MKIPVLIEPIDGNGYRASSLGPQGATAEGETDAEALFNLRKVIDSRISAGARFAYLDVAGGEPSVAGAAGIFRPNDPLVQEWKEIIAENRRRDDESPEPL